MIWSCFVTVGKVVPEALLMAGLLPLWKRTGQGDRGDGVMSVRQMTALGGSKTRGAISVPVIGHLTAKGNGLWISRHWAGSGVLYEFARYLFAGGSAFISDASILYSLTQFFRVNYLISAVFGFAVGVVVNYLVCRNWVFQRRRLNNTTAELGIFTIIGVVGLGMNELILWTFQAKLGIHYMLAKCVSGVVVLGWNFSARKLTLFQ